jgi:hypothetical protein
MARAKTSSVTAELKAKNERLKLENERLRQQLTATAAAQRQGIAVRSLRSFFAALLAALAAALLLAGNLLFWGGNTVVDNARFNQTMAPLVRNESVQKAVASYTTTQLYNNVDVAAQVQSVLPPRADFLAPTIASQLRGATQSTFEKVLTNPQFQDRWNQALARAHARFIATIKQSGGDGTINLNELYQSLSGSLAGTKLAFLANKQLPSKVGSVQVVQGEQVRILHQVIVHITLWRTLAILLFLVCAAASVYFARRRRRMVVRLGLLFAAMMLATLIAGRIARETVAAQVQPAYADAIRQAVQIVLHPLVVQTTLLLCLFLLVALVAWLTGASRSATYVQGRVQLLFAGKLHRALFGERENGLTRWVGRHKRLLQWLAVVVVALLMLVTRLTPAAFVWYVVGLLLVVLLIELLGA